MFTTLLVQPLFNILFAFYGLLPGHDFGVAIIMLTLVVRGALWPLVAKQLHSQKELQKLQPKIAAMRTEYAHDRQLQTEKLMELYKEHGTNPFASILPLLIQLPIFFALYFALRDSITPGQIAHLAYEPVKQIPYIQAILNGSVQFHPYLFNIIDLTKPAWALAVTAAAAQFYQTKQMQPKNTADLEPAARAMMSATKFLPLLTGFIALTLPSALALYWTVTSLVAILQQGLSLRKGEEELEAEVVSVKPVPAAEIAAPKKSTAKKRAAKKKARK